MLAEQENMTEAQRICMPKLYVTGHGANSNKNPAQAEGLDRKN